MNKLLLYLNILLLASLLHSCKNTQAQNTDQETQASKSAHHKVGNTQALILTQDFKYDGNDKDKISGPYIKQQKLELPQNIAPQNKWFMFEGPVLENELVAYRYYADSRHRFDIYGKKVYNLVMDTVSWDYHNIMDWGSDILKVGNSLGIGSPAIWYQDSLYTLSTCEKKELEIIETNKSKSTIRTTFTKLQIAGQSFDLIQDWSIESGSPWSEIHLKVVNGHLPEGLKFATGIVKHLPEIMEGESGEHFYAYNWGAQSFHEENMGMAIAADKKYRAIHINDELSHAYAFDTASSEVKYKFASVWQQDKNDIHNTTEFKMLLDTSLKGSD